MSGPPQGGVGRPGGDADELSALLDDEALAAAVAARRTARERRDRARELATWVGALRDLAERAASVRIVTDAGAPAAGTLVGVAADHLVVREAGGALTVVARTAITGVREVAAAQTAAPAAGDRPAPADQAMLEVLDRWREDAAPLQLVTRGGDTERGRLLTVGEDVVSLATTAGILHVPADAIVSVTVRS